MKLQETKNGQFFFNIPKAIATANKWEKGDELELVLGQRGEWILRRVLPSGA